MPIFPVPPVGPDEEGGHIHEVIREIVGNRNYSRKARFGEGRMPRDADDLGHDGRGIVARLKRLFRR